MESPWARCAHLSSVPPVANAIAPAHEPPEGPCVQRLLDYRRPRGPSTHTTSSSFSRVASRNLRKARRCCLRRTGRTGPYRQTVCDVGDPSGVTWRGGARCRRQEHEHTTQEQEADQEADGVKIQLQQKDRANEEACGTCLTAVSGTPQGCLMSQTAPVSRSAERLPAVGRLDLQGEERPRRPRPTVPQGEERPRRPRPTVPQAEERLWRPRPTVPQAEERPRRPRPTVPQAEERPRRPRPTVPQAEERPPGRAPGRSSPSWRRFSIMKTRS